MAYQISGPVLFDQFNAGIDFNSNGSPALVPGAGIDNFMTWSAGQLLYHTGGFGTDVNAQQNSDLAVLPTSTENFVLQLQDIGAGVLVPRWGNANALVPVPTPNLNALDMLAQTLSASANVGPNPYSGVTKLFTSFDTISGWSTVNASDFNSLQAGVFNGTEFQPTVPQFIDVTVNVTWQANANSQIGHRAVRLFDPIGAQEFASVYKRADPSINDTFTLGLNRQFLIGPGQNLVVQVAQDAPSFLPITGATTHLDLHSVATF